MKIKIDVEIDTEQEIILNLKINRAEFKIKYEKIPWGVSRDSLDVILKDYYKKYYDTDEEAEDAVDEFYDNHEIILDELEMVLDKIGDLYTAVYRNF